ncbi:M15 family peptidase [Halobacillus litoralis]|uniref:M15 family peptidase n=2 Tax=Bacillaceae TaxID=186817 RepID=A0A845DUZ0_9BACI|nr:M15 family peptidase [Halobacillus litoralis]MYL30236.1 M15 family peptidase [Halobacillus halophilus]MYL38227.1 M15 family peptidase [Halobacillus litoralis]
MPEALHPVVQENKVELVDRAAEKGIAVVITDGHRSVSEQDMLYEQGRSEEGSIVTYAEGGESYHNYGLAIDFAIETKDGRVVWDMNYDGNNNGTSDWMEVVEVAEDLGFTWGGDWKNFKDYPHLQMDFGLTIRELQYGKRPEVEDYAK